jgi:hypothetical protein
LVPYLIYRLVKRYRDQYCGGQIDFARAFIFSMYTFCFGALLASAAHYIYFAYIDGGAMVSVLAQSIEQLQGVDLATLEDANAEATTQFNQYIELMQQTIQQICYLLKETCPQMSKMFIWGHMIWFFSLI